MNRNQGKKLTEGFHNATVNLVKDNPKENIWKYFSINVTPKEHAQLTDWLDYICLNTGLTKKKVIHILVQDKYDEIKTIKKERMNNE
tara:strand:+ start:119 stop:379 length:261 start_codon:yes stop_codon:yes gene_type:complete